MRFQKSDKQKKIAKEHIAELFTEAEKVYVKHPQYAHKYIKMALLIRNKFNIVLTKKQKALFCKKCGHFQMPGANCSVRTRNGMTLYHCHDCGATRKFAGSHAKKTNLSKKKE